MVARNLVITHLLFVDDIMLFIGGSQRDITKIKAILSLFFEATGMVCNDAKSSISFMNLDNVSMDWIFSHFNFTLIDINNGIKYLGFIIKPNDYLKRDQGCMVSLLSIGSAVDLEFVYQGCRENMGHLQCGLVSESHRLWLDFFSRSFGPDSKGLSRGLLQCCCKQILQ